MLSLKLNDVDTSSPLLSDGDYILSIDSAEVKPSKDNPTNENLMVVFVTTRDETAQNGQVLRAGYKLTRYYPIPNEHREQDKNDMFLKGLTLLALAVCGFQNNESGKAQLPAFDLDFIANMPSKQVLAKVKTTKPKEDDTYGPKSEVASVRCLAE